MKKKVIVTNVFDEEKVFRIETQEGVYFNLEKRFLKDVVPQVRDEITLHIRYSPQIIGADINGKKVYRLSPKEQKELLIEQELDHKERCKAQISKIKDKLDEIFKSLPRLLQCRIEMFRKFVPDFRETEEIYELTAMFLGYKIYTACNSSNLARFEDNVNRFSVTKLLKSDEFLRTIEVTSHQVVFAVTFATVIFRDVTEKNCNLLQPTNEQIQESFVMSLPNAFPGNSTSFCWPRQEYIRSYISSLE